MPTDTLRGWLVAGFLTFLAALTRFTGLQSPTDAGTPVFDEKHYVTQAWQMLRGGWVEDNPAYGLVVHPPVGKQLIAFGEALFGYSAWGWRFSAAVAGVVLVLLVTRITRRLARSTLVGAIAGVLILVDGVTFVTSRMGMLDIFLVLFVVAAFGCLIVDRDDVQRRYARVYAEGRISQTPFGPRMGVRWWRFGAGVLLGLACATKWSGIYVIVFFGLMAVAFDLAARYRFGVRQPIVGTAARDVVPGLWALVAVPVGVYVASYWAWFSSETAVDRHAVGRTIGEGGMWSFLPDSLRALWYNHGNVLGFHTGLTNTEGHIHPWESKPWTWPMGLRPMLYYFAQGEDISGCSANECVRAVMLVGTPALWWLTLPVLGWSLWKVITCRDWRYAAALTGYAAVLVPWFMTLDRQMYYFYAAPMAPFIIMIFALTLGEVLGRRGQPPERQQLGLLVVCGYLAVVVVNFVWLYPILTALPITPEMWQRQLWLPSWR
ncbi:dolichyl-phosphate-mannose--protein mannosyltransferase [Hoyosella altamirensis]|uniref:Polyprenol-phosphate-mannose--protein mannosyltransferase n=1 Tax=Hoyosella altamirensis TaxID=616997 RepID=A0A839RIF7_9ACTN|nr:phospholipid carrier-dependent glycosyltransferase [Hoyosella altamirensis]MBB3035936.1 dolichyl-phosphate-mannose--protein O-mannosyl transferase [Hoyosella altamirensis]